MPKQMDPGEKRANTRAPLVQRKRRSKKGHQKDPGQKSKSNMARHAKLTD